MATHTLKNGSALTIAPLEVNDASEALAFAKAAGSESEFLTYGAEGLWLSLPEEEKEIRRIQDRKRDVFIKGVVQGKIISVLSVFRVDRPRVQHVGELGISVLQSHWHLGVGRTMCQEGLRLAKQIGMTKVNLRVREGNVHAIHLYHSLGFVDEGTTTRAMHIDGKYYSYLMMGIEF